MAGDAAEIPRYRAVESFCGPGGLSLGLHRAGFDVRLAFDADAMAVETHRRNLPGTCIVALAEYLTGRDVMAAGGLASGDLDLFSGGPPCQGFSKQKRGAHLGDARNQLVLEYGRLVLELRPRFFLLENVGMFGKKRGRAYLESLVDMLPDYVLHKHMYNCADYGLAQTRERCIIVGRRRDQPGGFRPPAPTVQRWRTVAEAIGDLPEPPDDYTDHLAFPNHQRARVTQPNIDRFSFVPQGGGWQDIPLEHRLECHKNADVTSGGWPDVYGRLAWDGQCPTITGGFDSFTRGRYGHPLHNRPLTPREAARIQGFPDTFVFAGTRANVRSQIGNAVPPPLAEAVGRAILHSLMVSDGLTSDEPAAPDYADEEQMLLPLFG